MKPSRAFLASVLAGLAAGISAELLAALYVRSNDGFGSGDLSGYAYWNVAFAVYFGVISLIVHRRLPLSRTLPRYSCWAMVGASAGFLWTWIVAGTIGPWILAFSFPVLYIWSSAGFLGGLLIARLPPPDNPLKWKRFWVVLLAPCAALVLSIALMWGLALGSQYLWHRGSPESFILPDGFVGQVYLIRDTLAGSLDTIVDGRRTYTFDASGIHRTSAPAAEGWLDQQFFYRKAGGSTTRLSGEWTSTIPDTPATRAETTVGVYFVHWGQYGQGNGCSVGYMSFFIGRQRDVLENRGIDSLETYLETYPPCRNTGRP